MRWIRTFALLALLIVGLGCTHTLEDLDETYVAESFVLDRWLRFLRDDCGSGDDVIQLLGPPTEVFEEGRIHVYRLILTGEEINHKSPYLFLWKSGYDAVVVFNDSIPVHNKIRKKLSSQEDALHVVGRIYDRKVYLQVLGREAEYSLVLLFDEKGTLRSHRLLRVRP